MGTQFFLLVFGVIIQFCNVSSRHNFYEYYYSRHHKGHSSTTESIFPSTSDILASSEYEKESSSPDDNSLQNNMEEVTDDTSLQDHKYESTVYTFKENYYSYHADYSSLTIGLIVAGVVIFLSVSCCLFCCMRHFCSRKERRGFIIGHQPETAREAAPQQNAQIHQPPEFQPQPHPSTQYRSEHGQFFPPQYQPQPMHQFPPMHPQFQYSPNAMQTHNPPEAPPPYEFPEKF